jgi:hypothetical protein
MFERFLAPVEGAEAPGVTKTQGLAGVEFDIDVIMDAGGCRMAVPLLVLIKRYLARRPTE